jgi:DNA-binding transcriptional LysR family regulator
MRYGYAQMPMMNWDDLRIFLAVARQGGLVLAARRLGVDQTTVARRLTALEQAVGTRLIHRSPRGARLTEAGLGFIEHAERMEAEALAAADRFGADDHALTGAVRLATPEAFGAYLVAPAARRFYERYPNIQLELVPEARALNLSRREADIAVSLGRPQQDRLYVQKLADYNLGLYASEAYLEVAGPIDCLAALRDHPLVWYIDELIDLPELRYLDQIARGLPTAFRSTSVVAQHNAVASGLGIGVLHAFSAEADPRLKRVLPDDIRVDRTYWMILHADQRHLPRVRAVAQFMRDLVQDAPLKLTSAKT